ncbi:MAG: glycosyltransferase family 2 protein [Coriobacteriia bacterium]|nr:glycosyltransferase family 2 protein [Coriobacteriia bacterium]
MPPIVAVVVTYNRKDLLLECIAHLRAQEFPRSLAEGVPASWESQLAIMVVDNASTDGTREALQPLIEEGVIDYRNTGANLGGAGGFNYGMREAVKAGYEYCWVMDDDCMPHPDSLQGLIDAHRHLGGQYGYLSSVVRWKDGSICKMNVQRHPLTRNIEDFSRALQPCTLASFVSLFVPCAIIREVGLPIKDFFIWTDDWEFTRRISRTHDCYVVGGSVVTHASANNGAGTIVDDVPERLDRYRTVYRNDVVLYRGEGLVGYGYLAARGLGHIYRVLRHSPDHKLKKVGIIVSSNVAGLRFHPPIEFVDGEGE